MRDKDRLILHYDVLAMLARGAAAQLKHSTDQRDMRHICNNTNERIEARLKLIREMWIQQELPL